MKTSSQRTIFTALFTFMATLSGVGFGFYELQAQADRLSDVLKISVVVATASIGVSYIIWTLTHLRKDSLLRGGLAGLLTGLAIVQIPYVGSALKTEFLRQYNSENMSVLLSALKAIPPALKTGFETFQVNSKMSLIAVISSAILGLIVAKRVPPREC